MTDTKPKFNPNRRAKVYIGETIGALRCGMAVTVSDIEDDDFNLVAEFTRPDQGHRRHWEVVPYFSCIDPGSSDFCRVKLATHGSETSCPECGQTWDTGDVTPCPRLVQHNRFPASVRVALVAGGIAFAVAWVFWVKWFLSALGAI